MLNIITKELVSKIRHFRAKIAILVPEGETNCVFPEEMNLQSNSFRKSIDNSCRLDIFGPLKNLMTNISRTLVTEDMARSFLVLFLLRIFTLDV